jgi:hypothetical protein
MRKIVEPSARANAGIALWFNAEPLRPGVGQPRHSAFMAMRAIFTHKV